MPIEVKNKYQNENIKFLSLSIDTDSIKFREFVNSNKFHFTDITSDNLEYRNAIINVLKNNKPDK